MGKDSLSISAKNSAVNGRGVRDVRVHHTVFGTGAVYGWIDARVVRVRFDSGDTRLLVGAMAGLTPARFRPPTASPASQSEARATTMSSSRCAVFFAVGATAPDDTVQ